MYRLATEETGLPVTTPSLFFCFVLFFFFFVVDRSIILEVSVDLNTKSKSSAI